MENTTNTDQAEITEDECLITEALEVYTDKFTEITNWEFKNDREILYKAQEEVSELYSAITLLLRETNDKNIRCDEIAHEFADVIIIVGRYLARHGFTVSHLVKSRIESNLDRAKRAA